MAEYRFERESRTPYSEQWSIESGEHTVGRVDIHFTGSAAFATLAVHTSIDDAALEELISQIDDRIVTPADPYREDFVVTAWRGEYAGVFAEDEAAADGDDEDEDADLDDED